MPCIPGNSQNNKAKERRKNKEKYKDKGTNKAQTSKRILE
jgi:hypothetical protein